MSFGEPARKSDWTEARPVRKFLVVGVTYFGDLPLRAMCRASQE
jgi:hypothetical protein